MLFICRNKIWTHVKKKNARFMEFYPLPWLGEEEAIF
jgi:hypothetical protein